MNDFVEEVINPLLRNFLYSILINALILQAILYQK